MIEEIIIRGIYKFNTVKNQKLIKQRNIGFEDVIEALQDQKNILGIVENVNYTNQFILEIIVDEYPCSIPIIIEEDNTIFLKTIYKNRKLIKKYKLTL